MEKEIKLSWRFNQSPEEVWDYLTRPELIEQWLMKSDFKPILGHRFRFTFIPKEGSNYEGMVNCEVLELEPHTRLSYSWNGKTKDQSRTFNSIVVWTLIPTGDGTELQLRHHGLTILEDILNHTTGWNNCIKRCEELINAVKNDSTVA